MTAQRISLETKGLKHDLTGRRFGRLFVISLSRRDGSKSRWVCSCACGNVVDTPITQKLVLGLARSCGRKGCAHTHGQAGTRLYNIWHQMRRRCDDPEAHNYKWYGAKGIKICREWQNFESFYDWAINNGYRPDLTIDRRMDHLGYNPSNCQWITQAENSAKRVVERKAHCKRGHKFTPSNSYWWKSKKGYIARHCRDCSKDRSRRERDRLNPGRWRRNRTPRRSRLRSRRNRSRRRA